MGLRLPNQYSKGANVEIDEMFRFWREKGSEKTQKK